MPVLYENIYPSFTSLGYQARLNIIEEVRRKRKEYSTPKRKQAASKREHSKKEAKKDKVQTLISKLTTEEREELLREIEESNEV